MVLVINYIPTRPLLLLKPIQIQTIPQPSPTPFPWPNPQAQSLKPFQIVQTGSTFDPLVKPSQTNTSLKLKPPLHSNTALQNHLPPSTWPSRLHHPTHHTPNITSTFNAPSPITRKASNCSVPILAPKAV